ncbi:WXG100 family type VII secretion target [Streptomyces sp. 21So2-11]|uniref:WXG100 family type VII secretion target n=1 Tax=Streptomyces sp. 21So2-11 TaxID=3144408 RepID=UPI00321A4442
MSVRKLNDQALKNLEDELGGNFENVKSQLRKLQAAIDGLEGQWQGIGANQFNATQTKINNNMVKIGKLLLNFQEAMAAARTISGNTEDEIAAALKGIDVADGHSGDVAAEKANSSIRGY